MVFDINTAIGHWPFRQVPNHSASQLRALLTAKGIGGAATVNTHGLFYLNCHDANVELAEAVADHAGFFVGVATLNPMYAAWGRDLSDCREKLGLRALRLAPQYHGYRLDCPEALAIAKAASGLGMPVLVPHRVVDPRGRHWFDAEQTVDLPDVVALCEAAPEATVIVTEACFYANALLGEKGCVRYPNLYLELSRARDGMCKLPAEVAAERMVFGTGAPFKCVTPALLKLDLAPELDEPARRRIGWENGRKLLGLM